MAYELNRQLIRATDATTEPLTTAELKTYMRVDHSDEDTLIGSLGKAARQIAEEYCQRSFITQTWKLYLQEFPANTIVLPMGRVLSVVGVDYAVSAAHDTELDSSSYHTALETDIGIIEPNDEWPDNDDEYPNGIEIEYTAGYGSLATDVPDNIKNAIYLITSDLYEQRATHSLNRVHEIGYSMKPTWQFLLDPYKIFV